MSWKGRKNWIKRRREARRAATRMSSFSHLTIKKYFLPYSHGAVHMRLYTCTNLSWKRLSQTIWDRKKANSHFKTALQIRRIFWKFPWANGDFPKYFISIRVQYVRHINWLFPLSQDAHVLEMAKKTEFFAIRTGNSSTIGTHAAGRHFLKGNASTVVVADGGGEERRKENRLGQKRM